MPQRPPRRRPASCGGLRPTSAARLAQSLEGGGDVPVKGHPNPFKADHAQFLQQQRWKAGGPGGFEFRASAPRPVSAARNPRQRQREQTVLQALERLEDKHTAERGVSLLEEVVEDSNSVEELNWFLRTVFDPKRPLVSVKARQQQLLLFRSIVRRFHTVGGEDAVAVTTAALKEKILPTLVVSLKSSDLQDAVVTTLHDILDCHVPEESPEMACHGFLAAGKVILQALLDPLALGMGWDSEVKRRCVTTLAALMPELLQKARLAAGDAAAPSEEDAELDRTFIPGAGGSSSGEVQELLKTFSRLLVQCLEVSSELHEGLLHCLAQLASDEVGQAGLAPYATELSELCAAHLTETPSAQPAYVPKQPSDARQRAESEPRHSRELTRDLALVCCACLRNLAEGGLLLGAEDGAPAEDASDAAETPPSDGDPLTPERHQLREKVLSALGRENLNLHRLTRGHEQLRRGIAVAKHAWENLGGAKPTSRTSSRSPSRTRPASASRPTRNRAVSSALAMRDLLDARGGRPQRGRSPDAAAREGRAPAAARMPSEGEAEVLGAAAGAVGANPASQMPSNHEGADVAAIAEPFLGSAISEESLQNATPTIHPSVLEEAAEEFRFETQPAATSSFSRHLEAAPVSSAEARAGPPPAKASQMRGSGPPGAAPGRPRPPAPLCGAGPMPVPEPGTTEQAIQAVQKQADSAIQAVRDLQGPGFLQEQNLCAPQAMLLTPGLEDPPVLASVLDFLAKGRLDLAMQCVFNLGNERTLRALLQRLDSRYAWQQLPLAEARHLARLLVALVCRDPRGAAAAEACPWLDALLCSARPDLESLLPREELPALQAALFSIAGATSTASSSAARVYYQLYHRQASVRQSQQGPMLRSLSAVPAA